MEPTVPFARRIAHFALASGPLLDREPVTETVLRSIVDTIGCIVGARAAKPVAIARHAAMAFQAPGPGASIPMASVIGLPDRVTIDAASFVNGLAARYLDYNDIYLSKEAVHPSDSISVALALAEGYAIDGRRVLDAVARGYEVHCRLADTVSTRKGGWDHVLLCAISSSIVAGILLGLDEAQLANAISIAATGNVALMETRVGTLSMWKAAACAYAARAGLFAAIHARYGLTGPAQALEGKHGLFAQVTGPPDPAAFDPAATEPRLLGVHLKAYPIGYFTQPAVDAALQLRAGFDPARTECVMIETTEFGRVANADGAEKWRPRTRETADHSLPYGVAVALIDGRVGEAQFTVERICQRDVQDLMRIIQVRENPDFTAAYPERVSTRIAIAQEGCPVRTCQVDYPRGHARNPMTRQEIDAKFLDLIPLGVTREIPSQMWRIADLPGQQTTHFLRQILTLAA